MAKASPTTEIILALNEMRWVLRTLMFFAFLLFPLPPQEGRPLSILLLLGEMDCSRSRLFLPSVGASPYVAGLAIVIRDQQEVEFCRQRS